MAKQHEVQIRIKGEKFKYDRPSLGVNRGDRIKWKLNNKFPYGIVIKTPISPLDWCFKTTGAGKVISAKVSRYALPGHYPYGVFACDGKTLLFDDPEIIIPPPQRG